MGTNSSLRGLYCRPADSLGSPVAAQNGKFGPSAEILGGRGLGSRVLAGCPGRQNRQIWPLGKAMREGESLDISMCLRPLSYYRSRR